MQGQFLVARGNAPELFEMVEITLNQIAWLITMAVIIPRCDAIGAWRYDGLRIARLNALNQGVTVIALVAQDSLGIRCVIQQFSGLRNIRMLRAG